MRTQPTPAEPDRLQEEAWTRLRDALAHADALAQLAGQALAAEPEPPTGSRLSGADIDRRCGRAFRLIAAIARLQEAQVTSARAVARLMRGERNAKNRRI
jgi:hypothetical protein